MRSPKWSATCAPSCATPRPTISPRAPRSNGCTRSGRLGEPDIYDFARERKFEQTVVALSFLCGVPVDVVERALLDDSPDMVLILARAAQCSWTTAKAILLMQAADRGIAAQDLDRALRSFQRLSTETAKRVLEFYRLRCQAGADAAAALPVRPGHAGRRTDSESIVPVAARPISGQVAGCADVTDTGDVPCAGAAAGRNRRA